MTEIWKTIPGYEGLYEVSDQGRVRSLDREVPDWHGGMRHIKERILKPRLNKGHASVSLCVEGRAEQRYVHQLVLQTFVGRCPEGMECCHENDIPLDNRLENLRWDTHRSNGADAERNGRVHHACGEAHGRAKLHATDIPVIRQSPLLLRELAKRYGVSNQQISRIKTDKRWRSGAALAA